MGPSTDCRLTVAVGDGLAGDIDVARWASVGPSYGEAPASALAAIAPSPADLAMVGEWGGLGYLAASGAPILAANLVSADGRSPLKPHRVVECAGRRVALAGLGQPGDWPDGLETEPFETTIRQLRKVSRAAPIVILLSNAGPEADRQVAAERQGIDVIVAGGEKPLESPERVGETLLVQTGYAGRAVGVLWLTFDSTGRLTQHAWERVMYVPQW